MKRSRGFADAWQQAVSNFEADLKADAVVGGSLYFVSAGQVLGAAHVGLADLATGRKIDADTIYHWASITKTFTAIALMQLRDRGLVSLQDSAARYVPALREVYDPFGAIEHITLRRLLTHSAGLREATFPWGGDKPWHPLEPKEWSTVEAMMPYTEIEFPPGSRYSYSNLGLSIIGRVIELVSGQPIGSYVEKNILRPLEMQSAYFDITPSFLLAHRSNNYFADNGQVQANGLEVDTGATLANGGLNSSVPDLVKYTSFLLGVNNSCNYDSVLCRKSLHEMWLPELPTDDLEPPRFHEQIALSFFVVDFARPGGSTRYIGHTGYQLGYRSFFYVQPESRSAVIWVVNSRPHANFWPLVRTQRTKIFDGLFPLLTG